jgi:hypothetical protein
MLGPTGSPQTAINASSLADRSGLRARPVVPWRWLAAAALLALALGAALYVGVAGERSSVAPAVRHGGFSHKGLLSLPVAAQGPVSATMGADNPAYRVSASNGGFSASNPTQRLSLRFARSGVSLSSGTTRVGLSLRAVGYGASLQALGTVAPRVKANRVAYAHPGLSEWYANGPLGLEQGFTISRAPSGHPSGALTLSLALSGNTRASLASGGHSITLRDSGGPSLRYSGLSATDAGGRVLHSWFQLHAGRILLRVDTRGARYPVRIDPFIQQDPKLTGTGITGESEQGFSVALSADGNTALVGGLGDNTDVGAAWVFTRSGSAWTQQGGKLTGAGEVGRGEFGVSVALSADGNTALIGGEIDNKAELRGAVWVFTRSGSTWTQQGGKLIGAEVPAFGRFGHTVALSADGNTALIGSFGGAWVFTRTGSTWTQQGGRLLGTGASGGASAVAISADGNTALIGGPFENDSVGAAWVFTRSGEEWTQQGEKLTGGGEVGKGWFGFSVALSGGGNTALIGGFEDHELLGAAWVFTRSGSTWSQQGEKLTGGGESGKGQFGAAVALSGDGNTALVGGALDSADETHFVGLGAAWVFTRSGGTWSQQGEKLTGAGETGIGPRFGAGVALSSDGTTALVGGPYDHANSLGLHANGAAWVFVDVTLSAPEYGRCLAVAAGTGKYENGSCTKAGGTKKFEWFPAVAKTHFTTNIKELTEASFTTVGKRIVSCTGETGTGEYSGQKTVANMTLTLTGCHLGEAGPCQSIEAAEGEVVTSTLGGELGVIKASTEGPLKNLIGMDLKPTSGEVVAAFACGGTPVLVTGSVIGEVPRNAMKLSTTPKFVASTKGIQKPTRFEGGEEDVLLTKLGESGPFEHTGLKLTMIQTNEEKVEINSVV